MAREHNAAVFRRREPDGVFEAMAAAGGPWTEGHCHGGAPAALLADALAAAPASVPMALARITVDLLGPVPLGAPLRMAVKVLRDGRRLQLLEAELAADGRCLARATGLRVRNVAPVEAMPAVHPEPDPAGHAPMPGGFSGQFTIVPQRGRFGEPGPAEAWFRLNSQLVEGAVTDNVVRAVATADFAAGISHELSFVDWLFPTLDLTVGFTRPPIGAWTLLEAHWLGTAHGRTTCASRLSDTRGVYGHALQTLLIEPRHAQ